MNEVALPVFNTIIPNIVAIVVLVWAVWMLIDD